MKDQNAFTLFEVLLAIFILTTTVYVLGDLQVRSLMRVLKDRDTLQHLFIIKRELYTRYGKKIVQEKEVSDLKSDEKRDETISVARINVSSKSPIKEFLPEKNFMYHLVHTWDYALVKRSISCFFCVKGSLQEQTDGKKDVLYELSK